MFDSLNLMSGWERQSFFLKALCVCVCVPLQLFETANKYHFYHSLALLGAAHCGKPAVVSTEA